ncbi:hypothetical protein ACIQM4_13995 [Streptomyces sp. NPDC091272]|uniref:hypothetical protein n=1 Tax=Streptomyces sp. NPDC091272 TaxID=3365981 RepID=UPI00381BCBCF
MSTATFTPGAAAGMAGVRAADHGHSGATAISDKPHRVSRALRAVRIFAGVAVGVVLLGDYAEEWKEDVRPADDPGSGTRTNHGTEHGSGTRTNHGAEHGSGTRTNHGAEHGSGTRTKHASGPRAMIPGPKDWRHERDAWASGRMSGDR